MLKRLDDTYNPDGASSRLTEAAALAHVSQRSEDPALPPKQIRDLRAWVLWRQIPRSPGQKPEKRPFQIDGRTPASVTDSRTWATYDEARRALSNGASHCSGLGVVLTGDLAGVDLDLPADDPQCLEAIDRFRGTYCERSPNGRLRIFALGTPRHSGKRGPAEVYGSDSPRYLTYTGNHIAGTALEVTEQQVALDWFHKTYFADPRDTGAGKASDAGNAALDDDDIIDKAERASNGNKFRTLFAGETSAFASPSEADLALCGILVFWTQDPEQIDRIIRRSGLFRPKWDQQFSDGTTYGSRTIAKAIRNRLASHACAEPNQDPDKRRGSTRLQQAIICVRARFPDLRYDDFKRRNVGVDEFTDSSVMLAVERDCKFTPTPHIIRAAITQVALARRFDSLRDFVINLPPWDGTERLSSWLRTYLGASDDPQYLARVSRYFNIGMIARALELGCKMDNALHLEGPQGIGKSTAVEIMGGEFFGRPSASEFGSRDHINEIQGRWLLEFPDLGNLSKADKRKLKAFFSEREDMWTKKYAAEPTVAPRRCCFVITDNPDPDGFSWLEDPTGARRIWSVTCGEIDLEGLRRDRLQLFAEARAAFEAGERWWPTRGEQDELFAPRQEELQSVDEWLEPVGRALEEAKAASGYAEGHPEFCVTTDAILTLMGVPVTQRTRAASTRVGKNLRELGLEPRGKGRPRRYFYKSPTA